MMSQPEDSPPTYSVFPPYGPPPPIANPINLQLSPSFVPGGSEEWNISLLAPTTISVTTPDMKPAQRTFITVPEEEWYKVAHKIFLKGRPLALGIVLIVTAILQIAFTAPLAFLVVSVTLFSGVQFWGGIFHIVAGSLSIAAHRQQNPCLIKGSIALCIASSLSGVAAFALNFSDTLLINGGQYDIETKYKATGLALLWFLLFMNVLVICVSFSIAVFGCCAVHNPLTNSPPTFVIQNDVAFLMPSPKISDDTPQ